MLLRTLYLLSFLLLLGACGSDAPKQEEEPTNGTSEKKLKTTPVIKVDNEPINIDPQPLFDQSQLTSKVLALCVKFKTLEGQDRRQVFNQLEALLPKCPMKILNDGEAEMAPDQATQVMSINDLKELLGAPQEVREDGILVYSLVADGSQRVVFMPEANGSVACRAEEGDS